jgi:AcrR family transcriptional regulator
MSDHSQNIKYQHLLIAGKELFWKHGIKRVSVEEICAQAKVSKMTFYKFFKNKKALVIAILENTVGVALENYKELIKQDYSFTDKVEQMLIMKLEGSKDISQEFILDIYKNPDLNLMPYMEEQGKKSLAITMDFLIDSQKKGHIRQDIKVEFILYYFNQMMTMTTDPNLISKYKKPQDLIMEATEFFFYGIGAKQLNK